MTPRDFVIWLKGFMQAANTFASTPKQWDDIRDQIEKVDLDGYKPIKYTMKDNSSISLSNLDLTKSESTLTYGRPEDSITHTPDNKKAF